jgi:hypothetical protein
MDINTIVYRELDVHNKKYIIRTKDMRTSYYPQVAHIHITGDQKLCEKVYEILKGHDGDTICE